MSPHADVMLIDSHQAAELLLTLGGRGRGETAAVRRELGVVDEDVKLGAATRVGAQRAVLVEVQLTWVHHFSRGAETKGHDFRDEWILGTIE